MITSINLKDVASYISVNGVNINDLKKVNFFFGFNGSGKSTIAKYLRNLDLDAANKNASFNTCSNVGYDNSQHQILTFNEEFIEENFRKSNEFKGVFSLNQSNALIDQQITDEEASIQLYETLRDKYLSKIQAIEADKKTSLSSLLNNCWNQRTTFTTFTKISLANSGSKPNHLQEINRILQQPLGQVLTIQEITEQYQTFYEKELKEIVQIVNSKAYLDIRRLEVNLEKLLQEVIVGNEDIDIAGLIQTLNARNWVEQGVSFLQLTSNTCPFCQKDTIDVDLRDQFNKFFDETYKNKISEIERLRERYKQRATSFVANITNIQNIFNPNNIASNLVIALNSLFEENIEIIDSKITHSNEKKSLVSMLTKKSDLSVVTSQIKVNNQLFKDADTNKNNFIKEIWKYIANNCRREIQDYDDRSIKYIRLTALSEELKIRYEGKITSARQNIETHRSQTVNTKVAVDNINLILKQTGFEGFEIDEKDRINNIPRYYLKRLNSTSTNSVFDSLSEGEKNFISFLYFYQLCLGTDNLHNNGSKKKIIVIDDPVSSLDSQALFIITTLVRELITRKSNSNSEKKLFFNPNIEQVFVLTHNFYFYKEVSFDKRLICNDYYHYSIKKVANQTGISGQQKKIIKDDYSLLWVSLKEIKSSNLTATASNIMLSNTMRRILESYVNFIGLGSESWSSLLNEDKNLPSYYIKCAFISTINDESHKVSTLDSIYYQKIIHEQPQALFNVFASIFKSIGKEHYEVMMEEQLQS